MFVADNSSKGFLFIIYTNSHCLKEQAMLIVLSSCLTFVFQVMNKQVNTGPKSSACYYNVHLLTGGKFWLILLPFLFQVVILCFP